MLFAPFMFKFCRLDTCGMLDSPRVAKNVQKKTQTGSLEKPFVFLDVVFHLLVATLGHPKTLLFHAGSKTVQVF